MVGGGDTLVGAVNGSRGFGVLTGPSDRFGRGAGVRGRSKEGIMLWTVAVILLVLWALGMGSSYTGGGMVHLLLVIAVIVVVFQFIAGRRSI